VFIDILAFVIGVVASIQGKLLAKLVVQALISVCHNQVEALYLHSAKVPNRYK
jgi:hypothetical protein